MDVKHLPTDIHVLFSDILQVSFNIKSENKYIFFYSFIIFFIRVVYLRDFRELHIDNCISKMEQSHFKCSKTNFMVAEIIQKYYISTKEIIVLISISK